MNEDPFVVVVRSAGRHLESFQENWQAMLADLRHRANEKETELVSFSPKRVKTEASSVERV